MRRVEFNCDSCSACISEAPTRQPEKSGRRHGSQRKGVQGGAVLMVLMAAGGGTDEESKFCALNGHDQ